MFLGVTCDFLLFINFQMNKSPFFKGRVIKKEPINPKMNVYLCNSPLSSEQPIENRPIQSSPRFIMPKKNTNQFQEAFQQFISAMEAKREQ